MNLQQFRELSEGDVVEHSMTHSRGIVRSIDKAGCHVAWGGNDRTFAYGEASTAWFHWEQISGCREVRPTEHGSGGNV